MAATRIHSTAAMQMRPEPMNVLPSHSKVKVSLALSDPVFVAGNVISGKMEMECKADAGLGIGIMMVELVGIQELTSRDHSATSTFLQSRRLFQGPGLPPSNAVLPHPIPWESPLPEHHHQARRGQTTFFFQIPTPLTSPSSINYGDGLACVRYEVRCAAGVAWKGERRLVTDKKSVEVVESYEEDDFTRVNPEGVIVGENGKIWVQAKVVGGLVVAGQSACVELQVKNHSPKRTTGLQVALNRYLHLPHVPASEKAPLEISDTLTTVAFRGPEYIVHPGTDGVASLVFDVPRNARSVKGGPRESDEEEDKVTECLFEVRCTLDIKVGLPFGSKDIVLKLPVTILHPSAAPQLPASPERFDSPNLYGSPGHVSPMLAASPHPYLDRAQSPYAYPALPISPPLLQQYPDHTGPAQPWLAPPQIPGTYQYFSPPFVDQQHYFPPPMQLPLYVAPPRPISTEPNPSHALHGLPLGLPDSAGLQHQYLMLPLDAGPQQPVTPEEGKGERASRIAHHLRLSSRHRSVSPQSHRFPLPIANTDPMPATSMRNLPPPPQAPPYLDSANLSAPPPGGVVYSPRPMLSPKHSFTIDPITHHSLPKSERVEELERMAEEVAHQKKDLSDDIPKVLNKTLPGPPVPSGKINLLSRPPGFSKLGVDAIFATTEPQSALAPSSETPPTPTLTAITPARLPRIEGSGSGQCDGKNESGLDALERRLLAEVGTRKMDSGNMRADVRSVLPIPIPSSTTEPLNDSAISSLSLADHEHDHDHDSDGRTQRRRSQSEDDRYVVALRRKVSATNRGEGTSQGKEKEREKRAGRKKERIGDDEAHRSRQSAKGRVAAWLGGIDPDASPPTDLSISITSSVPRGSILAPAGPASDASAAAADLRKDVLEEFSSELITTDVSVKEEAASAPNPRSSGFVPLATLRHNEVRRQSGIREQPLTREAAESTAQDFTTPFVSPPGSVPQSFSADQVVPRPSRSSDANVKNQWPQLSKAPPTSRLPSFPPSSHAPEIKYDISSARGGRGGRVAAVASIWASLTADTTSTKPVVNIQKPRDNLSKKPAARSARTSSQELSSSDPPSSSSLEPSLPDLSSRRARLNKSASVPAIVSSSHATPTLSSTASLAQASPQLDRRKMPIKLPPTVSESQSLLAQSASNVTTGKSQHSPGDLAFGQARLRDLIKKYQG